MPLIYQKSWDTHRRLAVWKITEDEEYFIQNLKWTHSEKAHFEALKGIRRIEWLSSRLLLCTLANIEDSSFIVKDNFGKPFIKDSQINISISHTSGYAAAYISPHSIGIDIQTLVNKIHRIAHKFLTHEELHLIPQHKMLHALHLYWGAKEALYKAYGRKQLKYREHIKINLGPILNCTESIPDIYPFQFTGHVTKDSFFQDFKIDAVAIEKCVLIHCTES